MIVIDLIYNLSVLVALISLSGFINSRFDKKTLPGKILQGILFGGAAIVGMLYPFKLAEGIIFDGRSIVISLCTLFFGPASGLMSAVAAIIFRVILGGGGASTGGLVITSSFLIGYLFFNGKEKGKFKVTKTSLYLFGILSATAMMLLMLTLPASFIKATFQKITATVMIFYPFITMLIGRVLLDQEENKNYLERIDQEKKLYRTTLYSIGDGVLTTDERGRINQINPVAEQLTGWKESEVKGMPLESVFKIINEETRNAVENPVIKVLKEGKVVGLANHTLLISKEGREIPIADSGAPIRNASGEIEGVVLVFRDQTSERESQKIILASLKEKEVLLKEIHHRVKNNFQRIISLISLQTDLIEDKSILNIFDDLQTRLRSMSLIHELMYGSGNFTGIGVKDYIERLTKYLIGTYSSSDAIKLILDVENHELDLETIIPCGLIVNEIVSNSLKYAFPEDAQGSIEITFRKSKDEFILALADNGVGIKENIDLENINSLGLRLVNLLTKQLKGSLAIERPEKGLRYIINFKGEN